MWGDVARITGPHRAQQDRHPVTAECGVMNVEWRRRRGEGQIVARDKQIDELVCEL
jgi:hypothetical protein